MQHSRNPLITDNNSDTIKRTQDYVEWLCLSADGDDTVHPGMLLSLQLVREAVASLAPEKQALENSALRECPQKV